MRGPSVPIPHRPDGEPAGPLLLCAFDHRDHFERLVAEHAEPRRNRFATVAVAKELVLEAALTVRGRTRSGEREGIGVFVDEQYGAHVALRARAEGLVLAMPAERSRAGEFECEFGDRFGAHIESFAPDLVKVLIRHNPEDDAAMLARQTAKLRELSEWCRASGRQMLVELLVLALPHQDDAGYVENGRPPLTLRALADLAGNGVCPAVWKLEAPADPEDNAQLLEVCRAADADVRVVILGGGASLSDTARAIAASAEAGFDGFAVGRTIWAAPLAAWLSGAASREATILAMADAYQSCITAYHEGIARRPAEVGA
jgi:myo-inositol catabolism protein IolC